MKFVMEVPDSYAAHLGAFATWVAGRFSNDEPPTIALFPGMVMPLLSFRLNPEPECICCAENECECEGRNVT